jgi:hypothetical protein
LEIEITPQPDEFILMYEKVNAAVEAPQAVDGQPAAPAPAGPERKFTLIIENISLLVKTGFEKNPMKMQKMYYS